MTASYNFVIEKFGNWAICNAKAPRNIQLPNYSITNYEMEFLCPSVGTNSH